MLAYFRWKLLESPIFLHKICDNKVYGIVNKIAEINKKIEYKANFPMNRTSDASEEIGMKSLFKKKLLITTILQTLIYFFSTTSYYSLIYFTVDIIPMTSIVYSHLIVIVQQIGNI